MDKAALPPPESFEAQLIIDGCDYWNEGLEFSMLPSHILEYGAQFFPSADNVNCNSDHFEKIAEKGSGGDKSEDIAMKKLSHNANERHRRKKLNALYEKLHSFLPHSNTQMKKKISNPAIVCEALKYISQLRREITRLSRQRDELLTLKRISEPALKAANTSQMLIGKVDFNNPPIAILTQVRIFASGPALLVSIQTAHAAPLLFSRLILLFEEEKLDVVNASTFVFDEKAWHNIQVKAMESSWSFDTGALRLKILHLCGQSRVISLKQSLRGFQT